MYAAVPRCLHGGPCRCLADMDELSMAAATLAVSMDIDEIDDVGVEPASSTSVTTDVLSAIDANQGVPIRLDAHSHLPSKPRGASSSHMIPSLLALFCPGPRRRQRAGGQPCRALQGPRGAACGRFARCAAVACQHHVLGQDGRGGSLRGGPQHVGPFLWPR